MDFVSSNFLCEEGLEEKQIQIYYDIYQGLGIAWEFIGLQCKHWDGFKKVRRGKEACKICGKLEDVKEDYYLLGKGQKKRIGRKVIPNSKKTFKNRIIAELLKDSIDFHGASIAVVPWEIRENDLKHFPVIFQYDDEYNFLGLTILR